jgi:serine/threonine protein kinase
LDVTCAPTHSSLRIASNKRQEQRYPSHPNRLIGHETNIWAVGAVMHRLLSGHLVQHNKFPHTLTNPTTSTTSTILVQGADLLQLTNLKTPDGSQVYLPYSRHLIDTILHCLAYNPSERLPAASLVRTTQEVLCIYSTMSLAPQPPDPFQALLQPNIPPSGKHRLGANPPPPPILQQPGYHPGFGPGGPAPQSPSPKGPKLLFESHRPRRPVKVRREEYPYEPMPLSP